MKTTITNLCALAAAMLLTTVLAVPIVAGEASSLPTVLGAMGPVAIA